PTGAGRHDRLASESAVRGVAAPAAPAARARKAAVRPPPSSARRIVPRGYSRRVEPLDRSTIWPYDARGEPGEFYYSRYASPTVAEAERRLGELDGGTALLYPSGSGATTALVLTLLAPGDTIALAAGSYYGTGVTFRTLERWGLRYVEFDQTGPP